MSKAPVELTVDVVTCACPRGHDVHNANCPTVADTVRDLVDRAARVIIDLAASGAPIVGWHIHPRQHNTASFPVLEGQVDVDAPDPRAVLEEYARRWRADVRDLFEGSPIEEIKGQSFQVTTELRGIHVTVWSRIGSGDDG